MPLKTYTMPELLARLDASPDSDDVELVKGYTLGRNSLTEVGRLPSTTPDDLVSFATKLWREFSRLDDLDSAHALGVRIACNRIRYY